jgi:hypothetical protein
MLPVIRHVPALMLLALAAACPVAAPAADPAPTEIRLGKASEPAPKTDPAQVRAVERFLAARQSASLDRSKLASVRRWLTGAVNADAGTLAGDPGQTLVAFDFPDGAIERQSDARFRVSVYLLFADRQGKVVQSRDETLTFTGKAGAYVCAALKTTNVMRWDSDEVEKSAARLHSSEALELADDSLHRWATQQTQIAAYSIEDVYPAGIGRIMVPCLKFSAEFGKRGYDVVDSPIMMRRGSKGYQIEPAAN